MCNSDVGWDCRDDGENTNSLLMLYIVNTNIGKKKLCWWLPALLVEKSISRNMRDGIVCEIPSFRNWDVCASRV